MGIRFLKGILICFVLAELCPSDRVTAQELVIPVWPDSAAETEHLTAKEVTTRDPQGGEMLQNVAHPTLTAYLPDKAKATRSAVIIAPGGAFMALAWRHEGTQVAEWFQERGVAAFVLKYRLSNLTDQERLDLTKEFMAALQAAGIEGTPGAKDTEAMMKVVLNFLGDDIKDACADGRQALGLVRNRAAEWGIDPDRIGIMGFSAGAYVTVQSSVEYDAATRPNFAAAIYGPSMPGISVPSDAPPLFILCTADDPLSALWSPQLYSLWHAAERPVELHVYSQGGHGFGMTKKALAVDTWIERLGDWMQAQGFFTAAEDVASASDSTSPH